MRLFFRHNAPGGGDKTTEVTEVEVKPDNNIGGRWQIRLYGLTGYYIGGGETTTPMKWLADNMEEFE